MDLFLKVRQVLDDKESKDTGKLADEISELMGEIERSMKSSKLYQILLQKLLEGKRADLAFPLLEGNPHLFP